MPTNTTAQTDPRLNAVERRVRARLTKEEKARRERERNRERREDFFEELEDQAQRDGTETFDNSGLEDHMTDRQIHRLVKLNAKPATASRFDTPFVLSRSSFTDDDGSELGVEAVVEKYIDTLDASDYTHRGYLSMIATFRKAAGHEYSRIEMERRTRERKERAKMISSKEKEKTLSAGQSEPNIMALTTPKTPPSKTKSDQTAIPPTSASSYNPDDCSSPISTVNSEDLDNEEIAKEARVLKKRVLSYLPAQRDDVEIGGHTSRRDELVGIVEREKREKRKLEEDYEEGETDGDEDVDVGKGSGEVTPKARPLQGVSTSGGDNQKRHKSNPSVPLASLRNSSNRASTVRMTQQVQTSRTSSPHQSRSFNTLAMGLQRSPVIQERRDNLSRNSASQAKTLGPSAATSRVSLTKAGKSEDGLEKRLAAVTQTDKLAQILMRVKQTQQSTAIASSSASITPKQNTVPSTSSATMQSPSARRERIRSNSSGGGAINQIGVGLSGGLCRGEIGPRKGSGGRQC